MAAFAIYGAVFRFFPGAVLILMATAANRGVNILHWQVCPFLGILLALFQVEAILFKKGRDGHHSGHDKNDYKHD